MAAGLTDRCSILQELLPFSSHPFSASLIRRFTLSRVNLAELLALAVSSLSDHWMPSSMRASRAGQAQDGALIEASMLFR